MPLELREEADGKIIFVRIVGKLTREDYDQFIPVIDRLAQEHGKIRFLCDIRGFSGVEIGAAWEDLKFTIKHYSDIERIGIIGEGRWHKSLTKAFSPMTRATVRYFNVGEEETARQWIEEDILVRVEQ